MLTFVKRDPNKGYLGRNLWLPKAHVNTRSIKAGLEFPIMEEQGFTYLQLWEDADDHLVVPREFILRKEYQYLSFPIVSATPTDFPHVEFTSNVVLDAKRPDLTTQKDAWKSMLTSRGGILNLACGRGKTCMALHYMAHKKVPTLVVVNNTTLIDQWRDRATEHLGNIPGGIGLIQGPPEKWDWEGRGIVLAMIHSLALRAEQMPRGMDRYFGLVITDECHHLSAPLFVQTAPLFYGERQGLTATVNREDGLEPIYMYHIGSVYHRDLEQDLIPRIYFQQCPVNVNLRDPEVIEAITDKNGRVCTPKFRSYLGRLDENNDFIEEKLHAPLKKGRKLLVLSHSVDQLKLLHQRFPESGLCIGDVSPRVRLEVLREKRLTFGTLQLVKEALDEATLDTLYFLTPFGSSAIEEGGFNTLQQGMGRVQRDREGKKTPVVVIIDHVYVPRFHKMCNQLRKQLRKWPKDQGGPLEYTTLKPYTQEAA